MIVDKNNELKRVQVKSSSFKDKKGNYQVALKSCGGTKGLTYKTIIDTNIEEIFIFLDNMDMYTIPKSIITNRSTINIGCSKYEKYKINSKINL